jgi:CubicO group peptidase (beta-lactamase class C family)
MRTCAKAFVVRIAIFIFLVFVALVGCSGSSSETSPYSATISAGRSIVRQVMNDTNATAVSVALSDGNGTIWTEAFGVTDKTDNNAVGTSTMFCIASVSKMVSTVAAMILVDRGLVSLDTPLVNYISDFSMVSPEYRSVTVRMLLNHTSGLPGTDERNVKTVTPYTGLAAQMMEGLKYQRLKHAPGYMSVYCNDGFTMIENLVQAVTGKSYPDFVRDEIFTPLGMTRSYFATEAFPDKSFARPHTGSTPSPYAYFNIYASGGLYSTAEDMVKLTAMLLNKGTYGSMKILSENAVASMGVDQTLGTFNPYPSDSTRFGLGWDTVTHPALKASGIKGWFKGGDYSSYGAALLVAPDEHLAIVVIGVSNSMSSGGAAQIAEKTLLSALVERGRIAALPEVIRKETVLPTQTPSDSEIAQFDGSYSNATDRFKLSFQTDRTLEMSSFVNGTWKSAYQGLKLRSDGWYTTDNDAVSAVRFVSQNGHSYFVMRQASGNGYYATVTMAAEKLPAQATVSDAWRTRMGESWLKVNDDYYAAYQDADPDPRLSMSTPAQLPGYMLVGGQILRDMSPVSTSRLDGMILLIPQSQGRDLMDLAVESWEGQEWLRFSSYLYRPLSGVPSLSAGQSTVTIGSDGFSEWQKVGTSGSITISGATTWKVLDNNFARVASGTGDGSAGFSGSGNKYLMVYGSKGATIRLNLMAP